MNTTVTDEQIRQLAESAKPYSMALLWWGPERCMDGADATELDTNDDWCHCALTG
ncbi:MAG: hypothetical protein ACR2FE_06555 [Aeromicrobium sp.]